MIHVIKEGTLKHYQFGCPHCGCVFQCDESDLSRVCQNIYTDVVTHVVIECPTCNRPLQIKVECLKEYVVNE